MLLYDMLLKEIVCVLDRDVTVSHLGSQVMAGHGHGHGHSHSYLGSQVMAGHGHGHGHGHGVFVLATHPKGK
jgi:hypothetical protein